jgi:hypothetical protein
MAPFLFEEFVQILVDLLGRFLTTEAQKEVCMFVPSKVTHFDRSLLARGLQLVFLLLSVC